MRKLILIASLFLPLVLFSFSSSFRNRRDIGVKFLWENDTFRLNQKYIIGSDTIEIHHLKIYISGIRVGPQKVPGVFLVNAELSHSFNIPLSTQIFPGDTLYFNIGMDSATTVNTDWTGALDPSHGMYWAWNTGYINWKMDGWVSSSPEIHHGLYTHIGGFLQGQKCYILKAIYCNAENTSININMKLLLQQLIRNNLYNIQHPGNKSVEFSQWILNAIY